MSTYDRPSPAGSLAGGPPSGVKLSGEIFKGTVSGEIVVDRFAELWHDGKIVTFHDVKNEPSNTRTWYLDARCELSPKNEFELPVQRPVSRIVRPRGTWTVTSRVRSQGSRVELYHFTLNWPRSWASKGYTSFTFGFKTPEEAQEWHRAITETLAGLGKGFVVPAHAHSGLPMNNQDTYNVNTSNNSLSSNAPAPEVGGVPFFADRTSLPDAAPNPNVPLPPLGAGLDDVSEHGGNLNTAGAAGGVAGGIAGGAAAVGVDPTPAPTPGAFAAAAASPALDDEAGQSGKQWRTLTESWVPYKQVNGVAIYHFEHTAASAAGDDHGGEFLVSTVIRGPPSHVLAALMHGSSHTTILGPASVVEMQSAPAAPGDKSQSKATRGKGSGAEEKVRLVLEAPGWAGVMCAPREMVVRRMLKTDAGMHVVLFSSVDKGEEDSAPKQEPRKLRSWYRRPVTGNVRGTYIIAPLNGHRLDTSPETMITCILKVDLAGVCGDRSWFRPIADTLGWTDAFLDRILMTVILVRDEVEHSRFVLDWQQVLQDGRGSDSAEHRELVDEGEVPAATEAKRSTSARSLGRMQSQFQRSGIKRGQSKPSTDKLQAIDEAAAAAVAGQDGTVPVVAATAPGLQEMQEEEEEQAGGGAMVDLDAIKAKSLLDSKYWEQIHAPGAKAYPYKVRGPTYLKDKKKIPGGDSVFTLASIDMYTLPEHVEHVARFLPSVRESGAPFAIAINLIIPGNPMIGLVANFITERHPNEALGKVAPINPMSDDHDWQPFDFVLHKFVNGDDQTRNHMLKLIPHIANGSWVIRQSVGTTPVIIGKALKTTYYQTEQYLEVDIDVSANSTAAYVTGMVRGATTGLVIDMGFVLEGTAPWELPECLLGGLRLNYLETKKCVPLDISREIPLRPAAKPSRGGA